MPILSCKHQQRFAVHVPMVQTCFFNFLLQLNGVSRGGISDQTCVNVCQLCDVQLRGYRRAIEYHN